MENDPIMAWLPPQVCDPPHKVTRPAQVHALAVEFNQNGWGRKHPYLVGYKYEGRVQLLSGTHRHAAATVANIQVPVVIVDEESVDDAWGDLIKWNQLMILGDTHKQYA